MRGNPSLRPAIPTRAIRSEGVKVLLVLIPQTAVAVGVLAVLVRGEWGDAQARWASARQLLCAGAVNGDTCARLVYGKRSVARGFAVKHNVFGQFLAQMLPKWRFPESGPGIGFSGWRGSIRIEKLVSTLLGRASGLLPKVQKSKNTPKKRRKSSNLPYL